MTSVSLGSLTGALHGIVPGIGSNTPMSDTKILAMKAPGGVNSTLWNVSTPDERRALLAHSAAAPANEPVDKALPKHHLGELSMVYETSFRPGQEAQASGRVSNGWIDKKRGKADPGGVSYGAYQFTSKPNGGNVMRFLASSEGKKWESLFRGKGPTVENGEFGSVWKSIAANEGNAFFDAQHRFWSRVMYEPGANKLRAAGFDVSSRHYAVADVCWSMMVQHGKAISLIEQCIAMTDKALKRSDPGYDKALINNLYDIRTSYVKSIKQPSLADRYVGERKDALAMLNRR